MSDSNVNADAKGHEKLRGALLDVIAQGLSGTWHCSRVWEAWNVGTMGRDDFSCVDESDTPAELVDAVLATLKDVIQPAEVSVFSQVARQKLTALMDRGYAVTGYALEKTVEGAQLERGFINGAGFVGWWRYGQSPQAAPAAVAVPDEREEFLDGAWYWVEKEGWIGDPPTIAPALYKAESDAWYSFSFSGIPTRGLKVLEPCLMQARATPPSIAVPTMDQKIAGAHAADIKPSQAEAVYLAMLAATPAADAPVTQTEATWCEYIAGMIGCYLKEPDESPRVKAIAGIIERRLWALPAPKPAAAPVVLPEPAIYVSGGQLEKHCDPEDTNGGSYIPARKTAAGLFTAPLYTEQQVRALLAQQLAIMPKGESAAAQLRAMATNYPSGHSWDKLDAKACIRGALEIEALRALLAGVSAPAAQADALAIPPECPHLIWYDDQDRRPEIFAGSGAKAAAARRFAQISQQWNAHLFVRTAKNSRDCQHPVATVAAPQAQADARDAGRYRGIRKAVYGQNVEIGEALLILKVVGECPAEAEFDAAADTCVAAQAAQQGGDKQ